MNKLLPCGADVFLIYKCPVCDSKLYISSVEAEAPHGATTSCCGKLLRLVPLSNIKVRFSNAEKKYEEIVSKATYFIQGVLNISNKESLEIVKRVAENSTKLEMNELVRQSLIEAGHEP